MKVICMLLNGSITNDQRVIRMINVLSSKATVNLFYINANDGDELIFGKNVNLFAFPKKNNLKNKIIQHSFFCREYDFFINHVLSMNIKYDYIYANDLPTLRQAYQISTKLNAKLIYDTHEIYIETLNQFFPSKNKGFLKRRIFKTLLSLMKIHGRFIESKYIRKTDDFITVNQSLLNYFKKEYKITIGKVIMNLPFKNVTSEVYDYRKQFKWPENTQIILYQGSLSKGRGLELLLSSVRFLEKRCKLIILGDGPLKTGLCLTVNNNGLHERVKFINKVSIEELSAYTKGADIGINLLESINLSKKLASPNKLFEYIHAELPVICSYSPENNLVLEKYKIGLQCHNEIESIVNRVHELININENEKKIIQRDLIKSKEEYCYENQVELIETIIFDYQSQFVKD